MFYGILKCLSLTYGLKHTKRGFCSVRRIFSVVCYWTWAHSMLIPHKVQRGLSAGPPRTEREEKSSSQGRKLEKIQFTSQAWQLTTLFCHCECAQQTFIKICVQSSLRSKNQLDAQQGLQLEICIWCVRGLCLHVYDVYYCKYLHD